MPIKFKCNSCQTVLTVKDELAGKKGLCPKCQKPITVPSQSLTLSPQPAEGLSLGGPPAAAASPAASPAAMAAKPPASPAMGARVEGLIGSNPPPADMKSAASRKLMIQRMGPVLVATIQVARITEPPDIRELGDALMGLLDQSEKPQILLDMSKVTYLPSAMIGKLTLMHKKALEYKGGLKFCAIAPGVMEIFRITRLDKMFQIYPDMSSAVSAFKAGFIQV